MEQRDSNEEQRRAVALTYDPDAPDGAPAPSVSAAGTGEIAERIIELAREHDVPVHSDPELVTLLAQLDVNQIIPPELYAVVAEVFVFVYRLQETAEKEC